MPYFMRKERDKYCVFKGTSNDPGELVKCHESEDDASAHMRALMANVSDAKSADMGILATLPPAATDGPSNWESLTAEQIMKAVGKEDELVTNPVTIGEQDKQDKDRTEPTGDSGDDSEKALSIGQRVDNIRDAFYRRFHKPTALSPEPQSQEDVWVREVYPSYLVIQKNNETFRVSYVADLDGSATFADPTSWVKVEQEWVESKFITYKSGDTYRWLAISNVAMWDREDERLTDKAYDDATLIGRQLGYGELDLVHVDGTDVGDCDLMLRMGAGEEAKLVQGGPWYSDPRSTRARKSVQSDPDYWGTSIKFVYDPAQFVDGVYHGGIRIKKCTILPRRMAASHGTAIAVLGGEQKMKELDQETREALVKLGIEESQIEELAERSKSLPDEANVVTKSDEPTILDQIKALLAKALGNKKESPEQETAQPDVAEQSKTETEVAPVQEETSEVTEQVKEVDTGDDVETVEPTVTSETVKEIADTVAKSLAPSIQQAMQPLADTLTSITQWQATIEKRLREAEKDVETKAVELLESQPPVVKVQTTTLKQAETDQPLTTILDSPANEQTAEFVKAVSDIVSGALKNQISLPETKLSQ